MKTIQSTENIELIVTENEILNNNWIPFSLVSKKLSDLEKTDKMGYKSLRNRLYNSCSCNKYNIDIIAGVKCINVDSPMKGEASLVLSFKRG